jgi:hypothetical protein
MTHVVFISYSNKDKPIADGICANLETAGIRCWIAPRDIAPGEDWPTAISRAISQSRIMVLVFSASSNSSEDVGRELILAANNKLVIIPFKIENIEPEPGKQYYLARTHWLDAINPPTQEQICKLIDYVKAFLAARGTASNIEIQPVTPNRVDQFVPGSEPLKPQPTHRKNSPWVRFLWIPVTLSIFLIATVLYVLIFVTHAISLPNARATTTEQATATVEATAAVSPTLDFSARTGSTTELFDGPGEYYVPNADLYISGNITIVGQAFDCTWLKVTSSTGNSGWVSADKVTYTAKCSDIQAVKITVSGCQLSSVITISNLTDASGTLRLWGDENFTFKIRPDSSKVRVCPGTYSYSFSTYYSNVSGYITGGGNLTLK